MTKPSGDGCVRVSEKYSATYPAEQAGIFYTLTAVKMHEKLQTSDIVRGLFLLQNFRRKEGDLMNSTIMYPRKCRKNILVLMDEIGVGPETAYAMMLMTAMLMDLKPEDDEVANMILKDCGVEV